MIKTRKVKLALESIEPQNQVQYCSYSSTTTSVSIASQEKIVLSILGKGDLIPEIPVYSINSARMSAPSKRKFTITNYFTFNDEADLNISPNPTGNQTELIYIFTAPTSKPFLIISDMNGQQILSKSISLEETADMQPGVYHVQLMDGRSLLKSMPLVIIK